MKTRTLTVLTATLFLTLGMVGTANATATVTVEQDTPAVTQKASKKKKKNALWQLGTLKTYKKAQKGYKRNKFGSGWAVKNKCDMRNRILQRDLTRKKSSNGCIVISGRLKDPYTKTNINFKRGVKTSSKVQIDHVVALSDAWKAGAKKWSAKKRKKFANDPLNLLAVQGKANMQKGDKHAGQWLPKSKSYQCTYVAKQIAVKAKYKLKVTKGEKKTMRSLLQSKCPNKSIAKPQKPRTKKMVIVKPTPTKPTSKPKPKPAKDVYYKNCTEARKAGVTPIYRGQPGYGKHLDRDGDGIACE